MKKLLIAVFLLVSSNAVAQEFLGINGYHYDDTLTFNGTEVAIGLELLGSGQGTIDFSTVYTNPAFEGTIGSRTVGAPGWSAFGITYRTPTGAAVDTGSVYIIGRGTSVKLNLKGYPTVVSSVSSQLKPRVEVVQQADGNALLIVEHLTDAQAELFSLDGKCISHVNLTTSRYSLDALSPHSLVPGMYFVRVTGREIENQNRSWYLKMLKVR